MIGQLGQRNAARELRSLLVFVGAVREKRWRPSMEGPERVVDATPT